MKNLKISKINRTISANASVAMEKYRPRSLRVGNAINAADKPPNIQPHKTPAQNGQPHIAVAIPDPYALIAKKACWPNEISPTKRRR